VSDGSRLYFTERGQTGFRIVQVSAAASSHQPTVLPIPLENPDLFDVFPDGSKLLIRTLKTSISEYDSPVWVYPLPSGEPFRLPEVNAYDASWSHDGKHLIYSTEHDIFLASADGQHPRRLITVGGNAWWFRWSRDLSRIRFTQFDP